jgi:hypothetical protein
MGGRRRWRNGNPVPRAAVLAQPRLPCSGRQGVGGDRRGVTYAAGPGVGGYSILSEPAAEGGTGPGWRATGTLIGSRSRVPHRWAWCCRWFRCVVHVPHRTSYYLSLHRFRQLISPRHIGQKVVGSGAKCPGDGRERCKVRPEAAAGGARRAYSPVSTLRRSRAAGGTRRLARRGPARRTSGARSRCQARAVGEHDAPGDLAPPGTAGTVTRRTGDPYPASSTICSSRSQ